MTMVPLTDVVIDETIYPRLEWSQSTVDTYAEALAAGEKFPSIILETRTNRLLDGMHRLRAHRQVGLAEISADHLDVPPGVPAKLYAASLSVRHGDRMKPRELEAIAREIAREQPEYSQTTIAKYCGVTRQTVGRWVSSITEHREAVRSCQVLLLTRLEWKQSEIAELLGLSQPTVSRIQNVRADNLNMTEDLLVEAAAALPIDVSAVIEQIREERIFGAWSEDERALLKRLRSGETIIVSLRGLHAGLIEWAESAQLYVRVDRRTDWGNPFELPADGDRDTVIRNYAEHYLPHKPSLIARLPDLRGKALGCWCAPEPCHGDVLKEWAEG